MDMGSHFAAKLEPFLLIAKTLTGAAAAKLIQDVTSAPGVFIFAELLELPNIQEVCGLSFKVTSSSDSADIAQEQQIARSILFVVGTLLLQDISGLRPLSIPFSMI
jgi:hypothetical protein